MADTPPSPTSSEIAAIVNMGADWINPELRTWINGKKVRSSAFRGLEFLIVPASGVYCSGVETAYPEGEAVPYEQNPFMWTTFHLLRSRTRSFIKVALVQTQNGRSIFSVPLRRSGEASVKPYLQLLLRLTI